MNCDLADVLWWSTYPNLGELKVTFHAKCKGLLMCLLCSLGVDFSHLVIAVQWTQSESSRSDGSITSYFADGKLFTFMFHNCFIISFQKRPSTYVWLILGAPLLFIIHSVVIFLTWFTVVLIPVCKVTYFNMWLRSCVHVMSMWSSYS